MPFGLENLSDAQKKALLIGVPAVALVAVGVRVGKSKTPATTTDPTAAPATGAIPAASTDAIGVGQLADFESKLTDAIQGIHFGSTPTPNPTPTPAPTPTPSPTPTPTPSSPVASYDIYPDRRSGVWPGPGAYNQCPAGFIMVQNRAENWWACTTRAVYNAGMLPSGTEILQG